MGYDVEQLRMTEQYLSAFATDEAAAGYHTVATLEEDLRRLAEQHPEIAELHEIGRSVEDRPLWALRIGERRGSTRKVAFLGCHHAREWISVEVPYLLAEHLLENSSSDPCRGGCSRARSGWPRWSTRTGTSTRRPRRTGCGARTGAGTRTAAPASTPTATTATCGARWT
jgi:hypothetical protein